MNVFDFDSDIVFINMVVSQVIREYLLEKFKNNSRLSSTGLELVIPSIFLPDDYKMHMSVNLDSGLWQCFASGNRGNIYQLFSNLEGVTYNKAESELIFRELQVCTLPPKPIVEEPLTYSTEDLDLIPVTVDSHESKNPTVLRAWSFLLERHLLTEDSKFYIAGKEGSRFAGRIIIPFEEDGELFYFQARSLDGRNPKYLNPSEGWPSSRNVLYPFDEEAEEVLVCEGPLDAYALQLCGVNATCTIGSSVSNQQMSILQDFPGKVVLAYDNDQAGQVGITKFDYLRRLKRMADLSICHPPSDVKDWNDALIKGIDLQQFVASHTKPYDYDYLVDHLLTTL